MNTVAVKWALQQRKITARGKLLLLIMAANSNGYGMCAMTGVQLSIAGEMDRRTVIYHARHLERRGLIEIKRGGGPDNPNGYRLRMFE